MATPLRQLFVRFRDASRTEREKDNYFERLGVAFIKNDPGMVQEYEDALLYTDWARAHGVAANDIGMDPVAKIRVEESCCAIQCKFYAEGRSIPKTELDKFLSACGMRHFSRPDYRNHRHGIHRNASALFDDLNVTTLGLDRRRRETYQAFVSFARGDAEPARRKRRC